MTEKKQNLVEKTITGKKEDHRNVVENPGFKPTQQTSTIEWLSDFIERLDKSGRQGSISIHIHNAECTVTHSQQIMPVSDENALLKLLIMIAPLMVEGTSMTAAEFIEAVLKKVPLMVKDSSITLHDLELV